MSTEQTAVGRAPHTGSVWRFPVDILTQNSTWQNFWARAVLISLPFQYVTLTHISGGIEEGDYGGVALTILLYLLSVWLVSLLLAIRGETGRYQERVRRCAFALIVLWTLAGMLLATSLVYSIWQLGETQDLVGRWICGKGKPEWMPCTVDYPGLNWQTMAAYTTYSLLAAAVIVAGAGLVSRRAAVGVSAVAEHRVTGFARAPLLITVALTTALLMTVIHSATALYGFSVQHLVGRSKEAPLTRTDRIGSPPSLGSDSVDALSESLTGN